MYNNEITIIDAHAHACGELCSIDGIMEYLERNNLSKVVLCPGEPDNTKNRAVPMISNVFKSPHLGYRFNKVICLATRLSGVTKHIDSQNQAIAKLASTHPDKIIQAYWVNPLESNCIEKLEDNYLKHKFRVVKMHQCWHDFDILTDNVESVVKWASNKHLPIFVHLLSKEQAIKFSLLASCFPGTAFIVGHMIGFEDITAKCKNENIYFDISAPYLISDNMLTNALNTAGSSRIILGSDTPYGTNNIKININRIRNMGLSIKEQEMIFSANFVKLLQGRSI